MSRGRRPLYPDLPRPFVLAHRGLPTLATENTMPAFRLAKERGAVGLELDVHLSADGEVVVFHDYDTSRLAPGLSPAPEIERTNWKDLARIEVGADAGRPGGRMPLLAELIDELGETMFWDIEVKNRRAEDYGLELALSGVLRGSRHAKGLLGRCAVSSFNPLSLARFRSIEAEIPTGIIWSHESEVPFMLSHGEGRWLGRADFLKPRYDLVGAASSWRWRRLEGYEFCTWTVDDPEEARRLSALGAAGLVSNRADVVAAALAT